ncbi:glucose PTS transporter subunit EIIB [Citrobacter sp. JGM124]|uniref:glucose PTS transporter subunit EIIB n=1 Tax=Citrobacter sp. JGM124 TaxID=2799789 RepID=UPI001BA996C4|nr:glucose PTS transporter subunit EIIB [Citrobacter sp. JGM124]MBS0849089.1 PTS transporter subunit EIIB [Citrobacter sp. JGM124]
MVSLKSLIHYSTQSTPSQPLTAEEQQQAEDLLAYFGGRDNIKQIDACITRLRITVESLSKVNSEALQHAGALGVIIIGKEVHAIFGKQSDNLRKILDERFSQN